MTGKFNFKIILKKLTASDNEIFYIPMQKHISSDELKFQIEKFRVNVREN